MNETIAFYKDKIFKEIEDLGPSVIALSDWMADNPELSGNEFAITRKVIDILESHGFDTEENFCGIKTAFRGSIKNKGATRIAYLMEYDALPDIGHGCGHNVSGCTSLLASIAFSKVKEAIDGELVLVGTPDEEAKCAKVELADKKAFDEYDFAMMIHMYNDNMVVKKFVALDAVEFTFTGKPSHAGTCPWLGVNALNGAQLFFHAVDMLRQHVKPDVRMHGVILEGGIGPTPNIVPDKAVVRFHFRSHTRKYLDQVVKKVMDCASGAAIATQTDVTYKYFEPKADEMVRNTAAEKMVEDVYNELGIQIDQADETETISSDIFRVSQKCPAIHSYLSICDRSIDLHTKEFARATKSDRAHKAIVNGAKILVMSALNVFHNQGIKDNIRAEFDKVVKPT